MKKQRWRLRYTKPAKQDLLRIRSYTRGTYGAEQEASYVGLIYTALRALADGPHAIGSIAREDIAVHMRTLHITLGGRRGRHFIAYRAVDNDVIEVLRILHDASDLQSHVSEWINQ